jgi:hypothetical protein
MTPENLLICVDLIPPGGWLVLSESDALIAKTLPGFDDARALSTTGVRFVGRLHERRLYIDPEFSEDTYALRHKDGGVVVCGPFGSKFLFK